MQFLSDLESHDGYRITDKNVIRDGFILFFCALIIIITLMIYGG